VLPAPSAGLGKGGLTFNSAMAIIGGAMSVQGAYVLATLLLRPFCYLTLNVLEPLVGTLEVVRLALTLVAWARLKAQPLGPGPPPAMPAPTVSQSYVAKSSASTRALLSEAQPGPPPPPADMWKQAAAHLTQGNPLDLACTWLTVIQLALSMTISLYIAGRRLVATAQVAAAMAKMKKLQAAEQKLAAGEEQPTDQPSSWSRCWPARSSAAGAAAGGKHTLGTGQGSACDEVVVRSPPSAEEEQLSLSPCHSARLVQSASEERSLASSKRSAV
jgi:hypothetical protein